MGRYSIEVNGVTQSLINNFLTCRMYAKLSILEGWSSLRPSGALSFGTLAHHVLEHVYGAVILDKDAYPDPKDNSFINRLIDQSVTAYMREKGQRLGAGETTTLESHAGLLGVILPEYFKHWKKNDLAKRWLSLEKEFEVKISDIKVRGKIDGVYKSNGKLFILDHKTKAYISEDTISGLLSFDLQMLLYLTATSMMSNIKPAGCLYNIIRRPNIKKGKKESSSQFLKRLGDDIRKRPEHYFIRYELAVVPSDLVEFKKEFEVILNEFRLWVTGKTPTYKNTQACAGKYGLCKYVNVCANGDYSGLYQKKQVSPELSDIKRKK